MDEGRCFTQETVGGWLIVTRTKPKSIFMVSDIEEIYSLDTPSGKPWARLAVLDEVKGASNGARDYFKLVQNGSGLCCLAIVTQSPIAKVFGNYLLRLNRTTYPRKLFESEDKAMQWIKAMMARAGTAIA